jgi:hypothetical protein
VDGGGCCATPCGVGRRIATKFLPHALQQAEAPISDAPLARPNSVSPGSLHAVVTRGSCRTPLEASGIRRAICAGAGGETNRGYAPRSITQTSHVALVSDLPPKSDSWIVFVGVGNGVAASVFNRTIALCTPFLTRHDDSFLAECATRGVSEK